MLVSAGEDKKAWDPVIVDLRGKTTVADYFVICDGETDRQLRSIADAMMERARRVGIRPLAGDGLMPASLMLSGCHLPPRARQCLLRGGWPMPPA